MTVSKHIALRGSGTEYYKEPCFAMLKYSRLNNKYSIREEKRKGRK